MAETSSSSSSKKELELANAIDMEAKAFEELKRKQSIGKVNNIDHAKHLNAISNNFGETSIVTSAIKPRPRPGHSTLQNTESSRGNFPHPQTLPLRSNNNEYTNEDLIMFDASLGNTKAEKLKSALPHLYEAKPNANPVRALIPFSVPDGVGLSPSSLTPDQSMAWWPKSNFSVFPMSNSFERSRLHSPLSPGLLSNPMQNSLINGSFQPSGMGLVKSQSLNTFPEFNSSSLLESKVVLEAKWNQSSASAKTSPVHQINHQKLHPKMRSTADDYAVVALPRQNERHLTKLRVDILPDKTKISPSITKQQNPLDTFLPHSTTAFSGNELIDFKEEDTGNRLITKVAVGEFDPLANRKMDASDQIYFSSTKSEGSLYMYHDPFDYLHELAQKPSDEVNSQPSLQLESGEETDRSSLELISRRKNYPKVFLLTSTPGGADEKKVERRKKEREKYYQKTEVIIGKCSLYRETDASKIDPEVKCFVSMISSLRSQFKFNGPFNDGVCLSPTIETLYPPDTSVKLVVKPQIGKKSDFPNLPSIKFTCSVESTMNHILMKVLSDLEDRGLEIAVDDAFIFGLTGMSEYIFSDETKLKSLHYVHQCYKFDKDVDLTLLRIKDLQRLLLRSEQDDKNDSKIGSQEIAPLDVVKTISYDELKILVEYLDNEIKRMSGNADTLLTCSEQGVLKALRPSNVIQSVKHLCALLGCVETLEVTETCASLDEKCQLFEQSRIRTKSMVAKPEIVEELKDGYAQVEMKTGSASRDQNHVEGIKRTLLKVREVVQKLLTVYTKTFRVNFAFANPEEMKLMSAGETSIYESKETLLLRICALHRIQPDWTFDDYMVSVEIFHGTCPVTHEPLATKWEAKSMSFYERVVFDVWIDTVGICSLPRESRIVLKLFGRKAEVVDKQTKYKTKDVGWASLQIFNFENYLSQGSFLLPLWPSMEAERKIGPAPDSSSHPTADSCPLISIELPELVIPVKFPKEVPVQHPPRDDYIFEELGPDLQAELLDLCDQDLITFRNCKTEAREVFWEKRYYLRGISGSLPKVLLSANSWDYASLPVLYGTLEFWKNPAPMDILQLLLPCFPDTRVKEVAIGWLNSISSDELVDFLPQMVEALKYETWPSSSLAKLLLERSLMSPRVAHSLYWLLTQSLPGESPQNSSYNQEDESVLDPMSKMKVARYKRRLQMFMRALYIIVGSSLRNSFLKQQELIRLLRKAALDVRESKEGVKMGILQSHLAQIDAHLRDGNSTLIPLSIGLVANSLDTGSSSFFPSNTLPLKLMFLSENGDYIPAMFKVGDDMRQDQLTMQMVKLMDKLWLREGLDLKMITFSCVPTGYKHGMIELVTQAKTLREIQVTNHGPAGSFRESSITEWLRKHNPSQLEFNTAVTNFTRSCAGYSIVTYILGICDRHNDNIMLKQTGHLFHIDFGKFLGDYQTFKGFKRDRSPFVLTQDMLYVINGGNKPSQKFQDFVDLCCKGYNIIRKNGNHLLNMFALMASSGIPGVTHEAVTYVQNALSPDLSSAEAADAFARLIEESLSNRFTQVNFFIHNLAQARFSDEASGDSEGKRDPELLSFSSKKYSMKTDGRIKSVSVYGIQKRYLPERHYLFILKIARHSEKGETQIFRTYKEFCELCSKLNRSFPKCGLPTIEKGLHLGRQEIREVAERRKQEVGIFLERLFKLENRISHSDLVYTFFHPILRDEEETDISLRKLKGPNRKSSTSGGQIQGKLKLSLEYHRNSLLILVCHAKDLVVPDLTREEPNSYVKIYLQPDPEKVTKRKTRVIHKNCHPSFMETIEYRINWDILKNRTLQASVWNTDRFQENQFLGGVEIPLEKLNLEKKDDAKWYSLTNLKRMSSQRMA